MESFDKLLEGLVKTRERFVERSAGCMKALETSFALVLDSFRILAKTLEESDSAVIPVSVLAGAARRVFSSFVLLESGLPQESQMVLRNGLEHMLVAIELIHDEGARLEWNDSADVNENEGNSHYFKPSKSVRRITKADSDYSSFEQGLARHAYEEWKKISERTIHLHSKWQVTELLSEAGGYQLLALKHAAAYKKDFQTLAQILFDIVGILLGIDEFQRAAEREERFHELYYEAFRGCLFDVEAILAVKTKLELQDALRRLGLTMDLESIPDTVELGRVLLSMEDPTNPHLIISYAEAEGKGSEVSDSGAGH